MKNFFFKCSVLVLVVLFACSCSEDDPIIEQPTGPEISIVAGSGFIADDAALEEGNNFKVKMVVTQGDNELQSIRLLVDGASVPAGEIDKYVSGIIYTDNQPPAAPQNPYLAVTTGGGTSREFIYEVIPFGQTVTYTWEVADRIGETAAVSIDITLIP